MVLMRSMLLFMLVLMIMYMVYDRIWKCMVQWAFFCPPMRSAPLVQPTVQFDIFFLQSTGLFLWLI